MRARSVMRRRSQAAASETSRCLSSMRRSRHWPRRTPISISTMFSQLACFGVWWNSSRLSTRRAWADAALQAYVDGVGQKLVGQAGMAGNYHFAVLDVPIANAHAMSNYSFVTRGLLASLNDEAELAAALGHELGHLAQHHAAQRARARQGLLDAAVEAAVVTGSPTVGRSVARDGLLALTRYSREQELEADHLALSPLVL